MNKYSLDEINSDEQLLEKIKNVDGAGSGLDADNLDGYTWDNVVGKRISTANFVEAGRGSGSVALTINDGYGNANIAFNHIGGVPEKTGNAARIVSNVDDTTDANIAFQVKSGVTAGTTTAMSNVMQIYESQVNILGNKVWHNGDAGKSLASNGYQKLPSGLIMQWVSSVAVNAKSTVTVTFPIAFPTASITLQATNRDDGGSDYAFNTVNYSATTVDVENVSSYNRTATLFAIGY